MKGCAVTATPCRTTSLARCIAAHSQATHPRARESARPDAMDIFPVVAITGPSGSGKSTLTALCARCLRDSFGVNAQTIHQDHFFLGPKPKSYWDMEDKDHPGAIDMAKLHGAVRASAEKLSEDASEAPKILLIEGFLLLQDVPIMGLVNAVLFVGADSPTCLQRRLKRSERTEHEREGCKVYYEKCVWPGFLKYTQPELEKLRSGTADGGGVHLHLRELDGEADVHAVAEQAMHALLDRLPGVQANPAAVREAVATAVLRSSTGVS